MTVYLVINTRHLLDVRGRTNLIHGMKIKLTKREIRVLSRILAANAGGKGTEKPDKMGAEDNPLPMFADGKK